MPTPGSLTILVATELGIISPDRAETAGALISEAKHFKACLRILFNAGFITRESGETLRTRLALIDHGQSILSLLQGAGVIPAALAAEIGRDHVTRVIASGVSIETLLIEQSIEVPRVFRRLLESRPEVQGTQRMSLPKPPPPPPKPSDPKVIEAERQKEQEAIEAIVSGLDEQETKELVEKLQQIDAGDDFTQALEELERQAGAAPGKEESLIPPPGGVGGESLLGMGSPAGQVHPPGPPPPADQSIVLPKGAAGSESILGMSMPDASPPSSPAGDPMNLPQASAPLSDPMLDLSTSPASPASAAAGLFPPSQEAFQPTIIQDSKVSKSPTSRAKVEIEGVSDPMVKFSVIPDTSATSFKDSPVPLAPLQVGTRFGRYELLKELGRGGQGIVYKATDHYLNRTVAIKIVRSQDDAEGISRFIQEAKNVAKLKHPNIVGLLDIGMHEGRHYFSMDYIEGKPLSNLTLDGEVPLPKLIAVLRDVCRAVGYAHSTGILHRDLKPDNVLVDTSLQGYVLDFGLAKEVRGGSGTGLSVTGNVFGTPQYMSPEQARGSHRELDHRSDVYSLGATLYFVLAHTPPFTGASAWDVVEKVISQDPIPPSKVAAGKIDSELETICLHAMEKSPARRYANALEMAEDLDLYLRHEPIKAQRSALLYRFWRKKQNRIAVAIAAPTVLLLGVLAFLGLDAAQREASFRSLLRQGDAALAQGDLDAALKAYGRAIILKPESEEIRRRSDEARRNKVKDLLADAQKALEAEDFDRVQRVAGEALDVLPSSAEAVAIRDLAARRRTRREVEALSEKAVKVAEQTGVSDATWAQYQKDLNEAIRASLEASKLDPEGSGKAAYLRGRAYHLLGQFSRASDAYAEALKADARHQGALFWKSQLDITRAFLARTQPDGTEWDKLEAAHLDEDAVALLQRLQGLAMTDLTPAQRQMAEAAELVARGRHVEALTWIARTFPKDVPSWALHLQAIAAFGAGDDTSASRFLTTAIAGGKGDFLALVLRGHLTLGLAHDAAMADFAAALRLNPAAPSAHYAYGCVWAALEKPAAAERELSEAINLLPEFASALRSRARLFHAMGRFDEALADIEAYFKRRPDPEALLIAAGIRRAKKDLDGAVAALDRFLALKPGDPDGLVERGAILREKRRFDDAMRDFGAVLGRNPKAVEAMWQRGLTYEAAGRADEADRDYAEVIVLDPGRIAAYERKGALHEVRGQWAEAEQVYSRLIDRDGGNPEAWILRGFSRARGRRIPDALKDFEQAISLDPGRTRAYLGRGQAFLEVKDLDRALAEFERAVSTNPSHPEGYLYRGTARLLKQNWTGALSDFNLAMGESEPRSLRYFRAQALHALGRLDDALADFQLAEQSAPSDPEVPLAKAMTLQAKKDLRGAMDAVSRSLDLRPGHPRALLVRGGIHHQQGSLDEAIADFSAILKTDPSSVAALVGRAQAYSTMNEPQAALADVEAALAAEPQNVAALIARGDIHSRKGEFDKAIAAYGEVLRVDNRSAAAFLNRGLARQKAGDHAGALKDLSSAIRIHPGWAAAYANRGLVLSAMNEHDAAIQDFSEAIKRDPASVAAYINRGVAAQRKGDARTALGDFSRAVQIDPASPEAYLNRGIARAALGELDAALADFAKAAQLKPGLTAAYVNRGAVLLAQEKVDAAIGEINRSISMDPFNVEAYVIRARIQLKKSAFDRALEDAQRALNLDPAGASAHHVAGLVYEALNNPAKALEHYGHAIDYAPADGVARFARGVLLVRQRRWQEAKDDLQQAARLNKALEAAAKPHLEECDRSLGAPK